MPEHKVHVETLTQPTSPPWYQWQCSCGAKGSKHDTHQAAMNFGIAHTVTMRPFVKEAKA